MIKTERGGRQGNLKDEKVKEGYVRISENDKKSGIVEARKTKLALSLWKNLRQMRIF